MVLVRDPALTGNITPVMEQQYQRADTNPTIPLYRYLDELEERVIEVVALGEDLRHTIAQALSTRALAQISTIPADVQYIRTAGFTVAGVGGALYVRASGSTPGGFQSGDGAWWQIAETSVDPFQFGAKGDMVANDTQAFIDMFATGITAIRGPKATFRIAHEQVNITTAYTMVMGEGMIIQPIDPGSPVSTNVGLLGVDADNVTISGVALDGRSLANFHQLSLLRIGRSSVSPAPLAPRRRNVKVRNVQARNAVWGIRAVWVDDLQVEGYLAQNMQSPENIEYGDGIYLGGCMRPILRGIIGRFCRRNVITLTHIGFLNTQDFDIDNVIAEYTFWSLNSAAVWIEMRDSKDPRGFVSGIHAKNCKNVIYNLDPNSEVLFDRIVGNANSPTSTTGIGINAGALRNYKLDGWATGLSIRVQPQFQAIMSGVSGTFAAGNTVTGGTSGGVGSVDFVDLQLQLNGTATTFEIGETVTDQTSGATGQVRDIKSSQLYLRAVSGTFGNNTIVGSVTGAQATITAVNTRLFLTGFLNFYPQVGETLTVSGGASGTIASLYQGSLEIEGGRISRCSGNAVVANSNTTPGCLKIADTVIDTDSYGIVLVCPSTQRYRKVELKDVRLRGRTNWALRVYDADTTPGTIDELVLDGFDTTDWTGSGKVRLSTVNVLKWRLGDMNPGTVPEVETISSDASVTLGPLAALIQRHTGTLTAARTITLPAPGSVVHNKPRQFVRSGSGAFKLNIHTGPVVALDPGDSASVADTGSAYFQVGKNYANTTLDGLIAMTVPTRAAGVLLTIPASVQYVRTAGYTTVGDNGDALYRRSASAPSHSLYFQSADGAYWILCDLIVKMEAAGATGLDATADMAAVTAICGYLNSIGGGKLLCKTGRTYYMDLLGSSSGISITTNIVIDLNYSTWKRPDGVVVNRFRRMTLWKLDANNASLEFMNGTIDANYTNNRNPDGEQSFSLEQRTSLSVQVSTNIQARRVAFTNLLLLDREYFDHCSCFIGTGATLTQLTMERCESRTSWVVNGRADLIWYRGIKQVDARYNVYLHRIETEFTTPEDVYSRVNIIGNELASMDLGFDADSAATAALKQVYVYDNTIHRVLALGGANTIMENNRIELGEAGAYVRPSNLRSRNNTWYVQSTGWTINAPSGLDWDVEHVRDTFQLQPGQAAPSASTYLITHPNVTSATTLGRKSRWIECKFLGGTDFDRIMNPSGNWAHERCTYTYKGDFAIYTVSGSRVQYGRLTNRIGGFEGALDGGGNQLATACWRFDNLGSMGAGEFIDVGGQWLSSEPPIVYANGLPNSQLRSMREIIGASLPGAALAGDRFKLQPPATDGPSEFIARATANSGAVWDSPLMELEFSSNGMMTKTGAGTYAARTIIGTSGQFSMANGDGVAGNPTISLANDVLIPSILTIPLNGLHLLDTDASHDLIIQVGSNLTADRILTITTGDAARTFSLSANLTVSGTSTINQNVSTTGNPQFATVELGHATDTTISRLSAGDIAVEGNRLFRVGGADVPVADGGTGASDASGARTNLGLGALSTKATIAVPGDITATGTPSSSTFLRGDGAWVSIPGGGDMLAVTYDPNAKAADAFAQDNMAQPSTSKTTPVNADRIGLWDSAASGVAKYVSWQNLLATAKTYFDTLYQAAGSYLTASSAATLTNKTFDAAGTGNALSNIAVSMFASNVADTDGTLAANSDTRLATQKAVKTYVAANGGGETPGKVATDRASFNPSDESGTTNYAYSSATAPTTSNRRKKETSTLTYTAKSASNKLLINYAADISNISTGAAGEAFVVAVQIDSDSTFAAWCIGGRAASATQCILRAQMYVSPPDTSSHTYTILILRNSNNAYNAIQDRVLTLVEVAA